MIGILLILQATCTYPAEPAQVTRDMRRAIAVVCRQKIAANPRDIEAYRTLGYALLDSPREGLEVLQSALRVAPDDYFFQLNAGLCLRQLNRLKEALAALKRAATLDSARAEDALVQAGLVAHQMGRYGEAEVLFRDALRRAPESRYVGRTWGYLARSLYRQDRYRQAVDAWDRADSLSPHGFIDEAGDRSLYQRSQALSSKQRP